MLRRAVVVAALSSVAILAVPMTAHATDRGGHGSGERHRETGRGSTGHGAFVEVRWATPVSSDRARPRSGDAALWPQHLATDSTCGVWLQYDRYETGPTTDRLIEGGVLYGPDNPREVLATRHPYPETGQPWTFVKAPDCGTKPTPATPTPTTTTRPPKHPSPCPTPSATRTPTPSHSTPTAPPVSHPSPSSSHTITPAPSATAPSPTTNVTTPPTTPSAVAPTPTPSSSVPPRTTPSATPSTSPTEPVTEVLAAGPTPTGGTGSASPTLPPSSPTPDTESLASTGSTGTAAVGLLAAVLAGAGALLVLARRRSAR